MQDGFVKTIDPKGILLGAAVVAAGVAIALIGVFEVFTLAIGRLALPTWSMYIAGGVVAVIGIGIAVFGGSGDKCTKCGKFATYTDAYFPLDQLTNVVNAVERNQPESLTALQKVPKNQMKTEIEITYCDGCGELAEVKVGKWEDYVPTDVLPTRVVSGEPAKVYRSIAKAHEEWRGDNEDE